MAKRKYQKLKPKRLKKTGVSGRLESDTGLVEYDGELYSAKEIKGIKLVRGVKRPGKQPLNVYLISALSIFAVAMLIPLLAGATVGIAIGLSGQDGYKTFPDNVNGYKVLNSSGTSGTAVVDGVCTGWPTTTSTLIQSENFTYGIGNNLPFNWTRHNDASNCLNEGDSWINIQVPMNLFPDPANFTFSRFDWDIISYSQYITSTASNKSTANYNMTLNINNTQIFDINEETNIFIPTYVNNVYRGRYFLNGSYEFDGMTEHAYRKAAGDCYPNCLAVINISGWTMGQTALYYEHPPFRYDFMMNMQTHTTNIDTHNFIINALPYFLALINCIIALAATPYWNPVFKTVASRMKVV